MPASIPSTEAQPELVVECIDRQAGAHPGKLALSGADVELTYAELVARVARHASGLRASGVAPGDVVAVFGSSHPDCFVLFLACCRVGAIYLGLNPKHQLPELRFVVDDASPRLLFAMHGPHEPGQDDKLRGVLAATGSVRETVVRGATSREGFSLTQDAFLDRGGGAAGPAAPADPDCACALVYTSGSTGSPKGALLSQRSVLRSARLTLAWFGEGAGIRTIAQHPINHVGWLVCECLTPLIAGGTVHCRERFDAAATLALIEAERLNLWLAFPAMIVLAMNTSDFLDRDLSSLKRLALGSVPAREVLASFRSRTGATAVASYGLTEASGGAVTITDEDDRDLRPDGIGRVLPGIQTRIVDADGREVPAGTDGELLIRDACVFLGYLNRPDATAAALDAHGWLHTGDIVRADGDGTLRLVGRLKEMYKSGGYNVYPTEVETVMASHPDVDAIAVVAVPDPTWTEVGMAFVAPRPGAALDLPGLRAWAKQRLANYKVPKRVLVVDELPLLPNGKYDKVALRERATRLLQTDIAR
jgi:acyl-CoA synthetase (AMP-forming)/AMP-acid ligase II